MDSKRTYKKISTIFWLLLATMPLWVSFFCTIFSYFSQCPESSSSANQFISNLSSRFSSVYHSLFGYGTSFEDWLFPFIYNPVESMISALGLSESALAMAMTWFVQVYMIELLVDILCWVPRLTHKFIEKWGA